MYTCSCSICGKRNVKLWYCTLENNEIFHICATCAEQRQVTLFYDECVWFRIKNIYYGKPIGNKVPLPKWKVDSKGRIPSCFGPGPDGEPLSLTTSLVINIQDIHKTEQSEITVTPYVPYPNSTKQWNQLPTR